MALLRGELYWMGNVTDHCLKSGRRGIPGAGRGGSEKEAEMGRNERMQDCERIAGSNHKTARSISP